MLRSHAFLLTGIFLNLTCHMVDTISKINHWFRAYTATLTFIKIGRKLFDKDTQVDVYSSAAQTSALRALINRSANLLQNYKTSNLTGVDRYAVSTAYFVFLFFAWKRNRLVRDMPTPGNSLASCKQLGTRQQRASQHRKIMSGSANSFSAAHILISREDRSYANTVI